MHILLNTFRRMRLMYENYSLSSKHFIFDIQTLFTMQKAFAKTFDETTVKMKASSPIQVTKNINYCFQLFLNQICAMSLICAPGFFLRAKSGGKNWAHRGKFVQHQQTLVVTLKTSVSIQITSLVTPVEIFMAKSRAS